jgi:leader peptidase (prepilin peptidase)/N-methyltransferase
LIVMTAILLVGLPLLGACVGSYANVVAARGWRAASQGRSHCDSCSRPLAARELVPVVSFLALGGRCRTCGRPIGTTVLAREVVGALVGLALAVVLVSLR